MSAERSLTVEEFERIAPLLDGPSELVQGRLRLVSPTNLAHGLLSIRIAAAIDRFLENQPHLGDVVGAETGFRVDDSDRPVIAPDAAFISTERMPEDSQDVGDDSPFDHFMKGPPDLAVEVRSPGDSLKGMMDKGQRWLAAGSREVWLIDGRKQSVTILRPDQKAQTVNMGEYLTSPDVLPGFSLPLATLFSRRRSQR